MVVNPMEVIRGGFVSSRFRTPKVNWYFFYTLNCTDSWWRT